MELSHKTASSFPVNPGYSRRDLICLWMSMNNFLPRNTGGAKGAIICIQVFLCWVSIKQSIKEKLRI